MDQVHFVSYIGLDEGGRAPSADALAARRAAVSTHLAGRGGRLIAEVREVAPGGAARVRPELQRALALCQACGAVLVVTRLERLALDPGLLAGLHRDLERRGLCLAVADMPEADVGMRGTAVLPGPAAAAEDMPEARRAGGRSVRPCMPRTLARALTVAPVLAEIRASGATTFEQVAFALNERGVPSARGDRWYPSQVRRVEQRIASVA